MKTKIFTKARGLMMLILATIISTNVWGATVVLDGEIDGLTSTTTGQGNNYSVLSSNDFTMGYVKYQTLSDQTTDNKFSSGKVIFLAQDNGFIKNKAALGTAITKLEIWTNPGASTTVNIGVCFSSSEINSYNATGAYTTTLSSGNTVYDASSAISSGDKFFYLKVTNNKNAQIQIRVTYSSTYTVTYDGNGKTGGTVPTDATAYTSGNTVTVKANTGELVRTGCTFSGWNTKADGSGTDYAASGSATFTITANTTLYAKWAATVTWNDNGGVIRTDNIFVPAAGKSVTPPSDPSTSARGNCGDKFMGWTTTENYKADSPSPGDIVTGAQTITGSVDYYAVFADYAE